MRRSKFFLPTLKEDPVEATIPSHQLMLRAGMIRQSSAGIYSWLPFGLRVLSNICNIVREEQNAIGCHEMIMPTIQPADLWQTSGRYEDYGPEMLRIKDRHDRDMLYGPTNEEQITEIFANSVSSYKDLPQILYHIQWKFRDEVRPRFGVMRGREFLMKDAYSFDIDYKNSEQSYNKMFLSYLRTYSRMGLKAIPMSADTGPIGGDMSHEFLILAETGESEIACHHEYMDMNWSTEAIDVESDLSPLVNRYTAKYAATDEKRNKSTERDLGKDLVVARGIEVGHIFHFGTKYSTKLGGIVNGPNGDKVAVEMGSYGIGISRLVGAIIEASHDKNGIIWPEPVAPFKIGLINLQINDELCNERCNQIYEELKKSKIDVLYDDRSERAGVKFAEMDLIGLPWQLIVGPRDAAEKKVELKNRKNGKKEQLPVKVAIERITNLFAI